MIKSIIRGAVFIAISAGASASFAQERSNPFTAPPSAAEEEARMDERMRGIVLGMQPEMRDMIMKDVTAAQTSLEIKMRRHVDAVVTAEMAKFKTVLDEASATKAAAGDGKAADGEAGAAATASSIPEGSKLVSCVDGKALYSDKDGNIFTPEDPRDQGNLLCAN